jgi:hypothetical protein
MIATFISVGGESGPDLTGVKNGPVSHLINMKI